MIFIHKIWYRKGHELSSHIALSQIQVPPECDLECSFTHLYIQYSSTCVKEWCERQDNICK